MDPPQPDLEESGRSRADQPRTGAQGSAPGEPAIDASALSAAGLPPTSSEPGQDPDRGGVRPDGNMFAADVGAQEVLTLDEPIDMAVAPGDNPLVDRGAGRPRAQGRHGARRGSGDDPGHHRGNRGRRREGPSRHSGDRPMALRQLHRPRRRHPRRCLRAGRNRPERPPADDPVPAPALQEPQRRGSGRRPRRPALRGIRRRRLGGRPARRRPGPHDVAGGRPANRADTRRHRAVRRAGGQSLRRRRSEPGGPSRDLPDRRAQPVALLVRPGPPATSGSRTSARTATRR